MEADRCVLIFDYWMDPSNVMHRFINHPVNKHTYVFASHFHEDHFTGEIFKWKGNRLFADCKYILSKDILKHRRAQKTEADIWISKGDTWKDSNITVIATGSNDSGISWIIEIEDKRIFHAGDLCNWYARFLSGNTPDKNVYSEEFGKYVNPIAEEKRFLGELKDIRKTTDSFDLVMFPVDNRIGNGYTLGARQFIERFKVGIFVPMHFAAGGFESAWRMEPFCNENDIPFWSIRNEGESIALINNIIIRKSSTEDIPRLKEIFSIARKFMKETGNPDQWSEDYPGDDLLRNDIRQGDSYVCLSENQIVATFVLREGNDPTYSVIYEGRWPDDCPYATIHRIAGNGKLKGILHYAMKFALRHHNAIRIDTHRNNTVMQNAIRKEGFKYCGIIRCWNGDERLAYQLTKPS